MFDVQSAVYIGKQKNGIYTDFIAELNFFLAIEVQGEEAQEHGSELVLSLKETLRSIQITHLAQLETTLEDLVKQMNVADSISLSVGILKGKVLYLKTLGEGIVQISRNGALATIIQNGKSASGYVQDNDIFIFTTASFNKLLDSESFNTVFNGRKPREIVDTLILHLEQKDDSGAIALFAAFTTHVTQQKTPVIVPTVQEKSIPIENNVTPKVHKPLFKGLPKLKLPFSKKDADHEEAEPPKKKYIFTTIIVIVISSLLIWSVVLGQKRRANEAAQKRVKVAAEVIHQKLSEAEDISFLNMPRALTLLQEAKTELSKAQQESSPAQKSDLDKLESEIKAKESLIVKKEDKSYDEFFDLTVDTKDAVGSKMYLDGDTAFISDTKNGVIYEFSLTKKSLDKKTSSDIKSASLIASSKETPLVFISGQGIYQINDKNSKKLIPADSDWGMISDLALYNGNIYLLDTSKSQIYKYVSTDNGYGDKAIYFKGGQDGLKDATSLAIDSSVYVSVKDHILKFTAGATDDFKTTFPDPNVTITKVITSKDLDKVYGWDKSKGAIYIMEKNGTYVKQVESSILTKADDVVISDKSAYILVKEKIYKMGLE